jgi:hypothetical protein
MLNVWQLIGVLLAVGFVGAYWRLIVLTVCAVVGVWLSIRAYLGYRAWIAAERRHRQQLVARADEQHGWARPPWVDLWISTRPGPDDPHRGDALHGLQTPPLAIGTAPLDHHQSQVMRSLERVRTRGSRNRDSRVWSGSLACVHPVKWVVPRTLSRR